MLVAERARADEAERRARVVAALKVEGVMVVRQRVICRSRLQWLARRLVKVSRP